MKRKRTSRAKNKIEGSPENSLIKVEPEKYSEPPGVHFGFKAFAVTRASLFAAELEEVIDIIARERVYRAMLAGMGRRLLMAPPDQDRGDEARL